MSGETPPPGSALREEKQSWKPCRRRDLSAEVLYGTGSINYVSGGSDPIDETMGYRSPLGRESCRSFTIIRLKLTSYLIIGYVDKDSPLSTAVD